MADSEKSAGATQSARRCRDHRHCVNEKGAERAIAPGTVTTLGYPIRSLRRFCGKNQTGRARRATNF